MKFATHAPAAALASWYGTAALLGSLTIGAVAGAQPLPPPVDAQVRSVEVIGSGPMPSRPLAAPVLPAHGDIAFNLPSTDVHVVAQAVLGDVLHVPFAVAPGTVGQVTAVTPYPIARQSVLPFLEEVLRTAHLALVRQNGTYTILAAEQARGVTAGDTQGGGVADGVGFATDIVHLQYVGAAELKALLDPVLPGVVSGFDPVADTITLSGTSGQLANARDILRQFDVNWLRRMSFALYIPQRSDSRLIVPELDKLLNAPDAPTRSMVRLIAMEKLNGILAVTAQPQYLTDVKRWIEVLDREGENNEEQLFVYRVQNGRSKDLAKTLNQAFGTGGATGEPASEQPNGSSTVAGSANGNGQTGNGQTGYNQNGNSPPPSASANGSSGPAQSGARRLNASISSDENNNAVVIFGTPHDYGIVLSALRKLDLPPYQVMIEAAIAEVTLTDDTRFGLQWQFNQTNVSGAQTQSANPLNLSQTGVANLLQQTPGFSVLFVHGAALSAVLNTLQTHANVNVVSAPKLMVLNNQTAALQVGDEVPILTQTASSNLTTTTTGVPSTVNSVDYKDTGVILKITPRVNEGGLVMLDLSQEVSSVVNNSANGIMSPTISTRKIATTVAVQDGEIVALGGMIQNSITRNKNGIPILSQIPVLGALFGNHENIKARTELIVLLKPHVLRTIDDGRAVTEELRNALRATQIMLPAAGIP